MQMLKMNYNRHPCSLFKSYPQQEKKQGRLHIASSDVSLWHRVLLHKLLVIASIHFIDVWLHCSCVLKTHRDTAHDSSYVSKQQVYKWTDATTQFYWMSTHWLNREIQKNPIKTKIY